MVGVDLEKIIDDEKKEGKISISSNLSDVSTNLPSDNFQMDIEYNN